MKHLLFFIFLLLPLVVKGQIETPGSGAGGGGGGGGSATNVLWANTLFVDATNGDDSTATRGDAAKPYKTASNAVYAAQSGDTVLFRPGNHFVATAPSSGWWTNAPLRVVGKTNMTIAGLEGASLILTNVGSLFWIGHVTNITFRDLHMVGVVSNSVVASNSAAIWVQGNVRQANLLNLKIHNWHSQGIATALDDGGTWGFSDWLIDGCDFYKIGNTNGFLAQAYDGTAVNYCGERLTVVNSTFRECWRAFESYNWPGGGNGEVFRDYVFANNKFFEIAEHAFQLIGTNQQNYTIVNNHFIKTNKTQSADYSYDISSGIFLYSASNFVISGNQFIGQRIGVEWQFDGTGTLPPASDITIENNMFRDTRDIAVYFWGNNYLTANARRPNRINVTGNTFVGTDAAIVVNANDSRISDNTIINSSRGSDYWGAIAVGWHFSVPENSIPTTNTIISGNVIEANNASYKTITIGTNAFNTRVYNNRINTGLGINSLSTSTLGLNSGKLTIDSGVLTANNPAIDISQTWSNSGVTFVANSIWATNILSGAESALFAGYHVSNGVPTTNFLFRRNGDLILRSPSTSVQPFIYFENNNSTDLAGSISLQNGALYIIGNNGSFFNNLIALNYGDVFFTADGTGLLQLGKDAATATAQTIKAHDGSGTDKAGADLSINGGQGTGSGVGGTVNFKTAPAGSTGSSLNSYVTRMSIDHTGKVTAPFLATSNLLYLPVALASPASTVTIDLAGGSMQYVTMTNNTTIAVTNAGAGRNVSVFFVGPTNNQFNLIMPSSIRLYSGAVTNIVTTNKSAVVSFTSFDGISTNLVTTVAIEP